MEKLTTQAVEKVFDLCAIQSQEMFDKTPDAIIAECILHKIAFYPEKIKEHKQEIIDLLSQLPDEFKEADGTNDDMKGGWSFLNACVDKDGNHWGEHYAIEILISLGLAIGKIEFNMPRDMWKFLPGGMPYFTVLK